MSLRIVALLIAALCAGAPVLAREAVKPAASVRDREPAVSPARDRQTRCGAEWRGLSAADKASKGPSWPQFYSKCVKRLKASQR